MNHAYLVHQFLEEQAQARPDAVLAVERHGRATYGEVDGGANRIARVLRQEGIRRGDRVGLLAANSREYLEAYYGILKAGGVVVSLNTAGDLRSHEEVLTHSEARGLICGPRAGRAARAPFAVRGLEFVLGDVSELAPREVGKSDYRVVGLEEATEAVEDTPPRLGMIDQDRAAIVYTSGSTGKPRGAVLRHSSILSNTRSIVHYLELTARDAVFVVLPFHYVYGKSLLNTHVAAGGRVILEDRFLYLQEALDWLEAEGATGLSGVPSTFAMLLNKSNFAGREMPSLRYLTQAGGAMAPELQRRLLEAFPRKRIFIMYGATEASARLSYLEPAELPRKLGSIGKAIPNIELRVLRGDGTEADAGEVGEIVARGSSLMEGYWRDPEATASVLDEDGYHTGDLGTMDEEGFLYVVGRKREMIKTGAHRISPKEIEEALVEHSAINEAAVIGVPDEMLGEAIAAFVTSRPGEAPDPEAIVRWCRGRLPSFKVPKVVRILKEFPRNASGKIDKLSLKGTPTDDSSGRALASGAPAS